MGIRLCPHCARPPLVDRERTACQLAVRPAGFRAALLLVGALVAAAALPPLGRAGLPGWLPAVAGVTLGTLAGTGFARLVLLRRFAVWLWPATFLFPAVFLLLSPVQKLAWSRLTGAPAEPAVVVPNQLPIVLIVLDELPITSLMTRAQEIDSIRYPNFARLARDAVWFRNAASVAHDTSRAVPAILTGKRPGKTQPATAAAHPDSLFTLLGASYRVKAFEPLTALCPPDLCPPRARLKRFSAFPAFPELGARDAWLR